MSCENNLKKEYFDKIENFINRMAEKKGGLITVLHYAQGVFGYLPHEVQEFVAEKLEIPLSEVYGVVSFYHYFKMAPQGRYPISVCMGTACYVGGAEGVLDVVKKELGIESGETTEDGFFSIDVLRCLGSCAVAPVILVKDKTYAKVSPGEVKKIIESYKSLRGESHEA